MTSFRLALVCDFREEGWPSMDLVGDMLYQHLLEGYSEQLSVEQLRAPFRRVFSRFPAGRFTGASWNADRLLNRFRTYPSWLRKQARGYDLFHLIDHSYAQLGFEIPPERTVAHCHDLDTFRCLLQPDQESRPRWFRLMADRILNGLSRAAHVFTISQSTREQILRYKVVSPDRLSVVYLGIHPAFSVRPEPEGEHRADMLLGAQRGVEILHVGSCIPRKRIDVLLRVFSQIRRRYPDARLIRVGGALPPAYQRLADELKIRSAIVSTPYIDHATLAALYRRSTLLLQPSDAEGFGLPVAEAMACGAPVIASDIPALREAAGSAALFCRAGDVQQWCERAIALLEDLEKNPDTRDRIREVGLQHASQFSWAETARHSLSIYRQLLQT